MEKKILFLDVDGTLIDYQAKLPPSAKKAVDLARKNGHIVYLCTGCSKHELYTRELPEVDGIIGANGGYVEDHGNVLFHKPLTLEEEKHIVDWCTERKLGVILECNVNRFIDPIMRVLRPIADVKYMTGKGIAEEDARKKAEERIVDMPVLEGEALYRDDVNKIDFVLSSYQDHLDSKVEFPELEANTWGGKDEQALYGDLGPSGLTKQTAIQIVLDYLHMDAKDAIAFGDAKIDLSMFEACGYGVAMGNGGKEIKEAADYITTDINDDGIYNAFQHLHLI